MDDAAAGAQQVIEQVPSDRDDRASPPSPAGATRVLVVDDVFDNRDILTRRLVRRGFDATEASGGVEALELLESRDFDIVLLDIMMPDMSGNEVLRTIRKTRSAEELPVIMVTAKTQSEDVVESLDLGANDYVTKPVDFSVALARINAQVERKRRAEMDRAAKETIAQEASTLHMIVERNFDGLRDISERLDREADRRRHSEEQLHYLAYHDALTGLLNRTAFRDLLRETLEAADGPGQEPTLLFLDLDKFKAVNDVHGHETGDRLLQAVAARLRQVAGPDAPIARLGGDEFATLVCDGGVVAGVALARRLIEAVRRPFLVDDEQFQIGASCGVAHAPECDRQLTNLLKGADLAMYRAKCGGRNRHVLFERGMLEEQQERSALQVELRQAIETDALDVNYQPLVCAKTGEINGFEALVRWAHPERGMLSPAKFIPLAEETGLIVSLGNWVLRRACAEATNWPEHVRLAVNLSPLQFRDPELVPNIVRILRSTGLDATRLELEITEGALLEAGQHNTDILHTIRKLGIRVSMDDFGTGYSSMNYLQNFEFDKIKIDRQFIRNLKNNGAAILKAIIDLGISVGVDTTAEGIETEEELNAVRAQGCTEIQGFYYSRPLDAEGARAFLRDHDRRGERG